MCGLGGGDVTKVGFEVSKHPHTRPSVSLFASCLGIGCKRPATAPMPCLPACCSAPGHGSHSQSLPSETLSPDKLFLSFAF